MVFNSDKTGFPIIENEDYKMRELRESDVSDLFEYYGDADHMKYNSSHPHNSKDETHAMIKKLMGSFPNNKGIAWAIEEKHTKKVIGNIGLFYMDSDRVKAGVGYNINKNYQNQGIATWALKSCIESAFMLFKVNEIEASCKSINYASERVMKKCGMKLKEVLQKASEKDGILYDKLIYYISSQ